MCKLMLAFGDKVPWRMGLLRVFHVLSIAFLWIYLYIYIYIYISIYLSIYIYIYIIFIFICIGASFPNPVAGSTFKENGAVRPSEAD